MVHFVICGMPVAADAFSDNESGDRRKWRREDPNNEIEERMNCEKEITEWYDIGNADDAKSDIASQYWLFAIFNII